MKTVEKKHIDRMIAPLAMVSLLAPHIAVAGDSYGSVGAGHANGVFANGEAGHVYGSASSSWDDSSNYTAEVSEAISISQANPISCHRWAAADASHGTDGSVC